MERVWPTHLTPSQFLPENFNSEHARDCGHFLLFQQANESARAQKHTTPMRRTERHNFLTSAPVPRKFPDIQSKQPPLTQPALATGPSLFAESHCKLGWLVRQ